jgi:hypothetical protein
VCSLPLVEAWGVRRAAGGAQHAEVVGRLPGDLQARIALAVTRNVK